MQMLLHTMLYAFVTMQSPSECIVPLITQANGVSRSAVVMKWLDFSNEPGTLYAIEAVVTGEMPDGIPTLDSISGDSIRITGLLSGTTYDIYLRALCADGPSSWSNPVQASTFINNNASCGLSLAIPDNACPQMRRYHIQVDDHSGLSLGDDIFLSSVQLIIEHPWVADLSVGLRSPSGTYVLLMSNRGVGVQNVGDPQDLTCNAFLELSMAACEDLSIIGNGQTGILLPEGDLGEFHDQGDAFGTWTLEICDKAADDIGALRFVHLNFTERICDFPPQVSLLQVLDSTALIQGVETGQCDSVYLQITDLDDPQDTILVVAPCSGEPILIAGLTPGHTYAVSGYKQCGADFSPGSCTMVLTTSCNAISLLSDFESTPVCSAECASSCVLSDTIWSNSGSDDMDWTVFTGRTPTEFTGPDASRLGDGKYLYTESSGDQCQGAAEAILESGCLKFGSNDNGCDLSFWYHMFGGSTGTLMLEISLDGGTDWDTLWQLSGDQGDLWQQAQVSLSSYHDQIGRLRLRAISGAGFLGDIAIDDIAFFGTTDSTALPICYYQDADDDGYGNIDATLCLCSMLTPPGYSTDTTDCDDENPNINPLAEELPCNLLDDNCNGDIDEGVNPDPVVYELVNLGHAACTGVDNGFIEIHVTGGTPPYDFAWSNGGDTAVIATLSPGMYQCVITDSDGCITMTEAFEIEAIFDIEYFVVTVGDPTCQGRSDGFISGIVQGGTPPYQFAWNSGHSSQDITGLPDGTYQVTVTDAQGCWLVSTAVILKGPVSFNASVIQIRHVSCSGGSNGMIRIGTVVGAVPPVSYAWSNGDTTSTADSLTAGLYTCMLTDSMGCTLNAGPYQIHEPTTLEAQVVSAIPPLCNDGADGLIQISVNGGSPPYFFSWAHGPFSQNLSGLAAGTYVVTITDLHGCDTLLEILLESPDSLMLALDTIVQVRCPADSSGLISVSASGGTLPYRFDWSYSSADTFMLTEVPPGNYSVTLSDASGCKASLHDLLITASNEPLMIVQDTVRDVLCHGDSSGYIVARALDGTAPYFFNWSAGVVHPSLTATDTLRKIAVGLYRVTVTDAFGCTGVSEQAAINQPLRLQFELLELTHNTCFGNATGAIDIEMTGGTPPYNYAWTTGDTSQDLKRLGAGMYQLAVTDSLGCLMQTPFFEILQPDSVFIDVVTSNEIGNMENGSAEVTVTGAMPPLSFLWDTTAMSQTNALATNLASGNYTITITDGNGCEYIDSVFIDRTTGILDPDRNYSIIFPNPAGDYFVIESSSPITSPQLYNLDGKLIEVMIEYLSETTLQVFTKGLPSGIYIVRTGDQIRRVAITSN